MQFIAWWLTNIGIEWSSKIAEHTWIVGGNSWANIGNTTVKNSYTNEIVNPATNTTYNAKIGLMYVSDYGYAASPANWNTNMGSLNNDTNRNNNWMFMGLYEWTISRYLDDSYSAFGVGNSGRVDNLVGVDTGSAVRPSFYLEPSVAYISGDGSINLPFRIN